MTAFAGAHGATTPESARPDISIVMPLYNRAQLVGRAIERLTGRARVEFELIVVDDGSTDGSADAARKAIAAAGIRGQVIVQENAGPGAARNTGVNIARAPWIVFHDSDDCWFPWTLDILSDVLSSITPPPTVVLMQEVIAPGGVVPEVEETGVRTEVFSGSVVAMAQAGGISFGSCNLAIRRDLFLSLGGFEPDIRYGEDTDLILRAGHFGPCVLIRGLALVALSRGSGGHLTSDGRAAIRGFSFILQGNSEGRYRKDAAGDPARHKVMAEIAVKLMRRHYENGDIGAVWRVYLANFGGLVRAGDWHSILRMPLVPILAVVSPGNYGYFRQARRRASGAPS